MDVHAEDSSVAGWLVEGNNRYLRNVYGQQQCGRHSASSATPTRCTTDRSKQNQDVGLRDPGQRQHGHRHQRVLERRARRVGRRERQPDSEGRRRRPEQGQRRGRRARRRRRQLVSARSARSPTAATASRSSRRPARRTSSRRRVSGDRGGKGNAGNGILVSGSGNGTANPIELEENTVKANGLVGIRVTGSGHQLKKQHQRRNGQRRDQRRLRIPGGTGNVNATGNKANGVTVSGSNGSAFPTSCIGS